MKPAEWILDPSTNAGHFKKIKSYTFQPEPRKDSEVTFSIFEKVKPFEKSDIEFVEKYFEEVYPGKDELFKDRFEKYIQEKF